MPTHSHNASTPGSTERAHAVASAPLPPRAPDAGEALLSPVIVALGLVLMALIGTYGIDGEFRAGHHGWCAARRSLAGLNLERYGFWETGFAVIENPDFARPDEFWKYWHHPHGMQLLLGLSFRLLGVGEWQARLPAVLVWMACVAVFARLARRLYEGLARAGALLLFITIPMLALYGPFVAMDPLVLLGGLVTMWLWARAGEDALGLRGQLLLFASSMVWAWSGWSWFVVAFAAAGAEALRWLTQRRLRLGFIVPHAAGTLAGLVGIAAHLSSMLGTRDPREAFSRIFATRSGGRHYPLSRVLDAQGERWIELFTPALIGLGALWLSLCVVAIARRRFELRHALSLVFLVSGILWVLPFKQGASIHEYWPDIAAPFFVVAGAELLRRLDAFRPHQRWMAVGLIALLLTAHSVRALGEFFAVRTHPPTGHPQITDDTESRRIALYKWLHASTRRGDVIVFDKGTIRTIERKQRHYYTGRAEEITSLQRGLRMPRKGRLAVLDLDALRSDERRRTIESLLERHSLTLFEGFAVVDLGASAPPALRSVLTTAPEARGPARWFSTPGAPSRVPFESLLHAADTLLSLGREHDAQALYEQARHDPVRRLEEAVAKHNLALHFDAVRDPVPSALAQLEDVVRVVHAEAIQPWRQDVEVEIVLEALGPLPPLTPVIELEGRDARGTWQRLVSGGRPRGLSFAPNAGPGTRLYLRWPYASTRLERLGPLRIRLGVRARGANGAQRWLSRRDAPGHWLTLQVERSGAASPLQRLSGFAWLTRD